MWEFLLWPFLCCVVLTGIHAYLGTHVVQRGVIFVDLSLGQIAALGTTVAYLAGFDPHDSEAYFFSLAFTVAGAGLFALLRSRSERVPQEALIGVVYVVASGLAILLLDRSPEGAEHIKYILVGNLLAVQPGDVLKMAALYAAMGALHWVWRKPFARISADAAGAAREGLSVRGWDFLFYTTFGVVVTSSVEVAGVLLVFSYLVVPAIIAMLFCDGAKARLLLGWAVGLAASVGGIAFSYGMDAPTGASIICAFGAALLAAYAARRFTSGGRRSPN
jgi:zinc/manganese transport system permease protein